ncbi:MAG: BUG/TctC family periplasmic protein, partial [uncultured Acetobacteraceae bacterium]
ASPPSPFYNCRRAGGTCRFEGAGGMAGPAGSVDRALPAGRFDRHHRPHHSAQAERGARQAGGYREPERRVRLGGGDRGRPGGRGRLHVAARLRQRGDEPDGDASPVQTAGGFRARQLGGDRPAGSRCPPDYALAEFPGSRRRREGGAGHDQLRVVRGGRARPRLHDLVATAGRLQADARPLPRRWPGLAGRLVGAGAAVHVQRGHHQPAHPRRHVTSARRHHRQRDAPRARRAELRATGLRRFRGADMVGVLGAGRNSPGHLEAHGRSPARHIGQRRGPRPHRGARRRRGRGRAGPMPLVPRRRGREVGKGHPRQQHNHRKL